MIEQSNSPLRHFESWDAKPVSQRFESYNLALAEARRIKQESELQKRKDLESLRTSTNPSDQYAYECIINEERMAAKERRTNQEVIIDPIANPVAAFEIARERDQENADINNSERSITLFILSGDPKAQFMLERHIEDIISDVSKPVS